FRKTMGEADDGLTGQIGGQELCAPIGRCYDHIVVFGELMKFFDEQSAQPVCLDVFDSGDVAGSTEDVGPGIVQLIDQQIIPTRPGELIESSSCFGGQDKSHGGNWHAHAVFEWCSPDSDLFQVV